MIDIFCARPDNIYHYSSNINEYNINTPKTFQPYVFIENVPYVSLGYLIWKIIRNPNPKRIPDIIPTDILIIARILDSLIISRVIFPFVAPSVLNTANSVIRSSSKDWYIVEIPIRLIKKAPMQLRVKIP